MNCSFKMIGAVGWDHLPLLGSGFELGTGWDIVTGTWTWA